MPSYRPSLGNLGGFCAFLARTRSVRRSWGAARRLLPVPRPARRNAENPRFGCELDAERPRSRHSHDICIAYAAQDTSTTPLLHPLQRCRSLHRTASKTMRRSLPLLALAALGAAFVLPPRQHLAVRVRADEIDAADDAAAPAERAAPEVNSGAEAVELRA